MFWYCGNMFTQTYNNVAVNFKHLISSKINLIRIVYLYKLKNDLTI